MSQPWMRKRTFISLAIEQAGRCSSCLGNLSFSHHQNGFSKINAQISMEMDHHMHPPQITMKSITVGTIHSLNMKSLSQKNSPEFIVTISHSMSRISPKPARMKDVGSG